MWNSSDKYSGKTAVSDPNIHGGVIVTHAKKSSNLLKLKNGYEQTLPIGEFSANRLLASLPSVEINRLLPYLQEAKFAAGDNICPPEEGEKYIYFPETAVFSQINFLEDGRTSETLMIGCEGAVNVTAVLSRQKSFTPWLQTLIGGSALQLNTSIFRQEFARSGFLHNIFFEYLNLYIRQISQKSICNQHHLIEERFCTWLLMIDDRRGESNLVLTHEQIAHFLGVHRPSVTCVAQNLREKEIIKYSRGHLTILNRNRLENSACECYTALKHWF